MMRGAKRSHKDMVAIIQGGYFVVTGLWPIFHMRSFEAISGRKKEKWLVKAMGAMIACVGGAVLRDGLERRADERTCRRADVPTSGRAAWRYRVQPRLVP